MPPRGHCHHCHRPFLPLPVGEHTLLGLGLYTGHPDIVKQIMGLIHSHGQKGVDALETIADVWDHGADKQLLYDPQTERAIQDSNEYTSALKKTDSDERVLGIRRARLRVAATRTRLAEVQEANDHRSSAA